MALNNSVAKALAAIVGPRWLRVARSELETFASDGLPTLHSLPAAVVMPADRAEVIGVITILSHHSIPFVARGAGTGLSGGALADRDSVVIALTRLTRIIRIDPENRTATVEPGVVNARLSQAVAQYGLHYAPDPSSQTACTIGGNIAENAGGPHCLKYGVTVNHVLELEVVLPDGKVVRLGSPSGQPWGPDLVGLFVGSEGMFGIATEIKLRLLPTPTSVIAMLADFENLHDAGATVSNIIASGIVPAALEMLDRNCIQAVESSIYAAGYPTDVAAVLLVEVDGMSHEAVQEECKSVREILLQGGARSVSIAEHPEHREKLWRGRKKAFGALGRISPDLVVQDTVVPRSKLPEVLDRILEIGASHDLSVSNVFHAGDGNLHPNINFDASDPDQCERVEKAAVEIMKTCIEAGGTITGEHGVGLDKMRYMPNIFDEDSLAAMLAVRKAFDPAELANPGKVVPTYACSEWKASRNFRAATR